MGIGDLIDRLLGRGLRPVGPRSEWDVDLGHEGVGYSRFRITVDEAKFLGKYYNCRDHLRAIGILQEQIDRRERARIELRDKEGELLRVEAPLRGPQSNTYWEWLAYNKEDKNVMERHKDLLQQETKLKKEYNLKRENLRIANQRLRSVAVELLAVCKHSKLASFILMEY